MEVLVMWQAIGGAGLHTIVWPGVVYTVKRATGRRVHHPGYDGALFGTGRGDVMMMRIIHVVNVWAKIFLVILKLFSISI